MGTVNLTSTSANLLPTWSTTTSASTVDLQKFGNNIRSDGWTLFYFDGVVIPSMNDNSGALVGGPNPYTWSFSFDLGNASFIDPPSMQVLYYDGINSSSGQYYTQRMSQELTVPEPSMLILLGFALIAVVVFSKKLRLV